MPLVREDDDAEEVVPVSSWAKQGLTPPVPHSTSQSHLIQYGPLTAQGNFLSHLDNQSSRWQAFPSNGAVAGLASDLYFDDPDASQAVSFEEFAARQSQTLDQWTELNGGYARSAYEIYGQPPHTGSNGYVPARPTQSFYDLSPTAPLPDVVPASSFERQAVGPWEGIWAFNPHNVAENFVYPSTDPPSNLMAETGTPAISTGPVQLSSVTVVTPQEESFSAREDISPPNPSPENWVVVARPSPSSLSEPSHAINQATPPQETDETVELRRASDAGVRAKTSKPERTKRNKTVQVQLLVPRRHGPLSVEQRQKADDMRYYGACWRCRRYKKPCNGPGDCDTCKTSGFRVWPSTIGCYRGNMEEFISGVMPGNAETIMKNLRDFGKKPNWKVHFGYQPDMAPLPILSGTEDRFAKLSVKLQATRMAGRGFVELLEILANFQRSRTKPDVCLEHACEALSYICDVYHAFVSTDTTISLLPNELLTALTKFRSHYSANWRHFLALCLSGRRSAWFPAFLCATINVPLLVVLKDGFIAIPEPARSQLWPNISFLIEDLRNRLYPMGLDLLSALAKGIKPWKLHCWDMVPCVDPATKLPITGRYERNPDGIRLLGGDIGAFDGFTAIQAWLNRNREAMHHGVSFLTTPPFSERNAKMQPIAALAWIFDVAPPGQKVVNGRLVEDLGEDPDFSKL